MRSLTPNPSPVARERGASFASAGNRSPVARERGASFASASRRPVEAARIAAKELRKTATRSENILWEALRSRRLVGRKFRRQHPIGQFVVDFCCLEDMLAVEIDGRSHDGREARDVERQRILQEMGLRFVRVSADDVERDLESVLDLIEASLAITKLPSPAHGRGAGGEGSC